MGSIHTVGPNKALITSGGCFRSEKSVIIGGCRWSWWLVTNVQTLSLELITLYPSCVVESQQGIRLRVSGVVHCKISSDHEKLLLAAEHFLGEPVERIRSTLLKTLEGYLGELVSSLTIQEVTNRRLLAESARSVCSTSLSKQGIDIITFLITDISDSYGYLESLGKALTTSVISGARTSCVEADKDATIVENECRKSAACFTYELNSSTEYRHRSFRFQEENFRKEVNTMKAVVDYAYQLAEAKLRQNAELTRTENSVTLSDIELQLKDKELDRNVRLVTEAERYRIKTITEGKKTEIIELAKAEGERLKKLADAEAYTTQQKGEAELNALKMKATVYKQFEDILSNNLQANMSISNDEEVYGAKYVNNVEEMYFRTGVIY